MMIVSTPVSFVPEAAPEVAPRPAPAKLEERRERSFDAVCARVVHRFAEAELAPELRRGDPSAARPRRYTHASASDLCLYLRARYATMFASSRSMKRRDLRAARSTARAPRPHDELSLTVLIKNDASERARTGA